jgi:class 3 adenylate cyclase
MSDTLSQSWLEMSHAQRFDLRGATSIGRAPDNALVLDDAQVSRRHAMIQVQGEGEYWLVDLGSANGSYLNGRRVAQPVELKAGDEITLSGVTMKFGSEKLKANHPSAAGLMASTMLSVRQAKCWMMMVDIIGSTAMSQQVSAEEWPRITGTWFKTCREIVEANGGHMMKYLGDGFFCYWLADAHSPGLVLECLNQLKPMQAEAAPPFRLVLHYGNAVLGSVPTMNELNLHGPEVNFTFRIEKLAGSFRKQVMFSEPANQGLDVPSTFVAKAKVDGFEGGFQFFAPL